MTWPKGTAQAIARSLDVYYRDAARTARMDRFMARFLPSGALAFDIGAHLGDRSGCFRRHGARVVAVEPQPAVFRALRLLYGRDPGVKLVNAAVGDAPGQTRLFVNTANPTVSTAAQALVAAAPSAPAWRDQVWDHEIEVPVTTLDMLISTHGRPDFVKIDVEGFEATVLDGLSAPLPVLAFEFTTLQRDVAQAALQRLARLGPYRFRFSLGETHHFADDGWVTAREMAARLEALPDAANSGDVYARLSPEGRA